MKGYGLFLISILIMGLGISLVTIADLGTTAISSLPYVLSFVFPFSFGTFTALMNIMFVFIQILLMKKEFPKEQYLQFFIGPNLKVYRLTSVCTCFLFFKRLHTFCK